MKLKLLFLTLVAAVCLLGVGFAQDYDVIVSYNDQLIKNEQTVLDRDGTLYVQFFDWVERFDLEMEWLEYSKYAVLSYDEDVYVFRSESDKITVNNEHEYLKYSTFTKDGKLYVPLYYIADLMGTSYTYDETLHRLKLTTPVPVVEPDEVIQAVPYTEKDLLWLARIVDVEANGASVNKKTAVANVVLNRVKSPKFANSIYGVIFESGQFPPAHRAGFTTRVPKASSFVAAERALMGVEVAKDCLYFNYRPHTWIDSSKFYKVIEGDYFYR